MSQCLHVFCVFFPVAPFFLFVCFALFLFAFVILLHHHHQHYYYWFLDSYLFSKKREKGRCLFGWVGRRVGWRGNCNQNILHEVKSIFHKTKRTIKEVLFPHLVVLKSHCSVKLTRSMWFVLWLSSKSSCCPSYRFSAFFQLCNSSS